MQSISRLCKSSWALKASENSVGRKLLQVEFRQGETEETPNWLTFICWKWGGCCWGWGVGMRPEKKSWSNPESERGGGGGLMRAQSCCSCRPLMPKFSEKYMVWAWTAMSMRWSTQNQNVCRSLICSGTINKRNQNWWWWNQMGMRWW